MTIFNEKLDLVFERNTPISSAQLWEAWTKPEILIKWFCPRPWKVTACEIDLRPGGLFKTVMQSPEGQTTPENIGTYLLVEQEKRLAWTNAMFPGFRPKPKEDFTHPAFFFVVDIRIESTENGCRYIAHVMHQDEASKLAHEEMGFHQGWGIAYDQLIGLYAN